MWRNQCCVATLRGHWGRVSLPGETWKLPTPILMLLCPTHGLARSKEGGSLVCSTSLSERQSAPGSCLPCPLCLRAASRAAISRAFQTMAGLGLGGYTTSESEDDAPAASSAPRAEPPPEIVAAPQSSQASGFAAFGSSRGRTRIRKGGLPLFRKPVTGVDSSESEDEVPVSLPAQLLTIASCPQSL